VREVTAIAVVILAASATAALCPWLIGFLQRRSMVDVENGRTSHRGAVPRGGGLAVLFGGAVSLAVHWNDWTGIAQLRAVAVFAVAFGLLGLADDVRTLPAGFRLGMQAILAVGFMAVTELEPIATMGIVGAAIAAFWIMAFVNAFNFMDGINGISAATAIIVGATHVVLGFQIDSEVLSVGGAALLAAALCFTPFNFPSARMFLGDVGSYYIGSYIAVLSIIALRADASLIAVIGPLALYLIDTSTTLVRRAIRGESLWRAHREHTYQVLASDHLDHTKTTIVVATITIASAVLGLLTQDRSAPWMVLCGATMIGLTIGYLRLPSALPGRTEVTEPV